MIIKIMQILICKNPIHFCCVFSKIQISGLRRNVPKTKAAAEKIKQMQKMVFIFAPVFEPLVISAI